MLTATTPLRSVSLSQKLRMLIMAVLCFLTFFALAPGQASAADDTDTTNSNQAVAIKINGLLDKASQAAASKQYQESYRYLQNAYFKYYDPILEGPSMSLTGNRKPMMEGLFGRAKAAAKKKDHTALIGYIKDLKVGISRDALILDGVLSDSAPEAEKQAAGEKFVAQGIVTEVSDQARDTYSFITAFTLLLREGLEALLVVAAIVLYLVRAGQRHLTKYVYGGVLAAIVFSILLAYVLSAVFRNAGAAQEILEGATMFVAVAVLFYISHWMLSKSNSQAWENYVQSKISISVSQGKTWLLAFAAFLAVAREGAELILFYAAAFQGNLADPLWVGLGIGAATIILVAIFIVFRFFAVKLPIGLVFKATSVLLIVLAIIFIGNGVVELGEGGFIIGETSIPALTWITFPELGLYPRAETLLPQFILLVAALWMGYAQASATRRRRREQVTS